GAAGVMTWCLLLLSLVGASAPSSTTQSTTARAATTRSAQLDQLKSRFVQSILPAESDQRQKIIESASRFADSLQPDGSWADVDYKARQMSNWSARAHLERLLLMAKSYQLSPNAQLKGKTFAALSFWLEKDFQNPNWWWNQIGVPQLLGETGLLI